MFLGVIVVNTALRFIEYHRRVTSVLADDPATWYSAVVTIVVFDAAMLAYQG